MEMNSAVVMQCAEALRSMLVSMGQRNPASTKEIMTMFTEDFCIVCGGYFPRDSKGPCEACSQEAKAFFSDITETI